MDGEQETQRFVRFTVCDERKRPVGKPLCVPIGPTSEFSVVLPSEWFMDESPTGTG